MAELTLESLAKRVEVLEKQLESQIPSDTIRLPSGHLVRKGEGDKRAAIDAFMKLKDYDYGALEEQERVDMEEARKGIK